MDEIEFPTADGTHPINKNLVRGIAPVFDEDGAAYPDRAKIKINGQDSVIVSVSTQQASQMLGMSEE